MKTLTCWCPGCGRKLAPVKRKGYNTRTCRKCRARWDIVANFTPEGEWYLVEAKAENPPLPFKMLGERGPWTPDEMAKEAS